MAPKSVLITGCSEGGIGFALAKAFHRQGLRVFATARNLAKLQSLTALGLEAIQLDVASDESISQAVDKVAALTGGRLDFLVNNSGAGYHLPLLDCDVAEAKKIFDVNVFGLISVTQAFFPLLYASKGTVVVVGSAAGKAPIPFRGCYNASKAAANLLAEQLRIELSLLGVQCITVVTGSVRTKFYDNTTGVQLPADSSYTPAKGIIDRTMSGALSSGMDADVFADGVVKNALKSRPTKVQWLGAKASLFWFIDTFGWSTVWDHLFFKMFKLGKIREQLQAAEKSH